MGFRGRGIARALFGVPCVSSSSGMLNVALSVLGIVLSVLSIVLSVLGIVLSARNSGSGSPLCDTSFSYSDKKGKKFDDASRIRTCALKEEQISNLSP